jgi:hypothetical protein
LLRAALVALETLLDFRVRQVDWEVFFQLAVLVVVAPLGTLITVI